MPEFWSVINAGSRPAAQNTARDRFKAWIQAFFAGCAAEMPGLAPVEFVNVVRLALRQSLLDKA